MSLFLESHKENLEYIGFWQETLAKSLYMAVERTYDKETVRDYMIAEFLPRNNASHYVVKWVKRIVPLSDEVLFQLYGFK